ncbi:uncharacterized protein NEMAJ01_2074 [Nematocida major]|uniref:uncharacterized protein n=1 Tax=Nematocida major TaxID=1912982 RepID=UPI002008C867|nr:uncharacterized protein NEMAJ01_2074 [Nematocida major]KAH9387178.1 hypothetical protein NEMAJ01_2074 [Nematocida major]
MLRESYRNFNMCLFTKAGTPLPLDDNEMLLYTAESVGFHIVVGEGGLFDTYWHKSDSGSVFITNCRVIYIPRNPTTNFCSFFCKSTSVMDAAAKEDTRIRMSVSLNGNVPGKITLKMKKNLPDTFLTQLSVSQDYLRALE